MILGVPAAFYSDYNDIVSLANGMKVYKNFYGRSSSNTFYARVAFSSTLSASSSVCLRAVMQPMNSLSAVVKYIYAYKYQSNTITGVGVKSMVGSHNEVYTDGTYVYVKCSSWNALSVEVINLDGDVIEFPDIVGSLPSGSTEATMMS